MEQLFGVESVINEIEDDDEDYDQFDQNEGKILLFIHSSIILSNVLFDTIHTEMSVDFTFRCDN